MKKYIIKNCSAYCDVEASMGLEKPVLDTCINYRLKKITQCKDISDCLLKQIVEKCKEAQLPIMQWEDKDSIWTKYSPKSELAKEILDLLDIEEIEVSEDD